MLGGNVHNALALGSVYYVLKHLKNAEFHTAQVLSYETDLLNIFHGSFSKALTHVWRWVCYDLHCHNKRSIGLFWLVSAFLLLSVAVWVATTNTFITGLRCLSASEVVKSFGNLSFHLKKPHGCGMWKYDPNLPQCLETIWQIKRTHTSVSLFLKQSHSILAPNSWFFF